MSTSLFTVIIPVYNGERFLREAVESVWKQTQLPAEIIVVDDCSTDGSRELIQRLAVDSPVPMRLIQLPRNSGGPAQPINIGIREAKTEYLAVLDQDDIFHPARLYTHQIALNTVPEASVVFGLAASTTSPDDVLQPASTRSELLFNSEAVTSADAQLFNITSRQVTELLLLLGNFTYGFPGFSFRREKVTTSAVDVKLRICGDFQLLFYLATQGPFVFHNSVSYWRRLHNENLTCNNLLMNYEDAMLRIQSLKKNNWVSETAKNIAEAKITGLAYWLREAGYPIKSMMLYARLGMAIGWNYQFVKGLFSAFPLFLYRKLTFKQHRVVGMTMTKRTFANSLAK
ncbi:MAG TPA: glycosyltransferase family A protein [Gemmatales bacterium]|nr:glycosyltransferase family A protein [Gemmatales bacterium]HMP16753.1 glycosyltransferase family A protein [Gemmatales bacterium]